MFAPVLINPVAVGVAPVQSLIRPVIWLTMVVPVDPTAVAPPRIKLFTPVADAEIFEPKISGTGAEPA